MINMKKSERPGSKRRRQHKHKKLVDDYMKSVHRLMPLLGEDASAACIVTSLVVIGDFDHQHGTDMGVAIEPV